MALSPKLELRQSQGLVMTPQLMQAIKLLQMSNLELSAYVDAELESNPLLEREEEGDGWLGEPDDREAAPPTSGEPDDLVTAARETSAEALTQSLDGDYDNVFTPDGPSTTPAASPPDDSGWAGVRGDRREYHGESDMLESVATAEATLHEHLLSQLMLGLANPSRRLIARHIVDLVDEAGYLTESAATVADRLGADPQDVEAVIAALQACDPPGVGARDLAECLAIQLRERNRLDPAMAALVGNLDVLAKHDFAALKRLCAVDDEDLRDMISELRQLDPKPGHAFGSDPLQPVAPDVLVRARSDGGWQVELTPETLPRVLVDQLYLANVSAHARSEADRAYLSDCLQKANWLVRSLDQRARTVLKVASEIVRQQDAFLTRGVHYLRPLTLRMVADAIEMHESTVSRVTANKYMSTPRGIFELKYFFTTAIGSAENGAAHSAEAVRHRIRELIDAEPPDGVLSDDEIVAQLRGASIDIARRTVAKYRESMKIPSSVQRRREKRARL